MKFQRAGDMYCGASGVAPGEGVYPSLPTPVPVPVPMPVPRKHHRGESEASFDDRAPQTSSVLCVLPSFGLHLLLPWHTRVCLSPRRRRFYSTMQQVTTLLG